jgi:hypothetical protein
MLRLFLGTDQRREADLSYPSFFLWDVLQSSLGSPQQAQESRLYGLVQRRRYRMCPMLMTQFHSAILATRSDTNEGDSSRKPSGPVAVQGF